MRYKALRRRFKTASNVGRWLKWLRRKTKARTNQHATHCADCGHPAHAGVCAEEIAMRYPDTAFTLCDCAETVRRDTARP